jgi:SPX domain protein involved in polyphosphate accumulation
MSIQKFSRYEFKYLMTESMASEIEREVSHFMDYDGYVHPEMGNRYTVRSLYFENEQLSNFNEKVDGVKKRRKYRLRSYSSKENHNVPVFFEEKGRNNQRTYKNRMQIKYAHLDLFTEDMSNLQLKEIYPNNKLLETFIYERIKKRLHPLVLIEYERRPYINKYGLLFRMTFDSNVRAMLSNKLYSIGTHNTWILCRPGYTILEVKFERNIPPWFHRIIQCYNLSRISISKMVIGVESCGLAKDI